MNQGFWSFFLLPSTTNLHLKLELCVCISVQDSHGPFLFQLLLGMKIFSDSRQEKKRITQNLNVKIHANYVCLNVI